VKPNKPYDRQTREIFSIFRRKKKRTKKRISMYHDCDDESGDQGDKSCRSAPQHTCVQQQLPSSKLLQREGERARTRDRESPGNGVPGVKERR
jgi:hypothetical protein